MHRQAVSSSNIRSIGYDAGARVLEVEFLNGSVYQYHNVHQHLYDGLMRAASHGSYLDQFIKRGGFAYTRVR